MTANESHGFGCQSHAIQSGHGQEASRKYAESNLVYCIVYVQCQRGRLPVYHRADKLSDGDLGSEALVAAGEPVEVPSGETNLALVIVSITNRSFV